MARVDILFTQGKDGTEYVAGFGVYTPCSVDELLNILKQARPEWQVAPGIAHNEEPHLGLMICDPNGRISRIGLMEESAVLAHEGENC